MQQRTGVNFFVIILSVLCLISLNVLAQENPVPANDTADQDSAQLRFTVDLNRFQYADSLTFLEFTLSLFQGMLNYQETDEQKYIGQFLVTAELLKQDSVIARKKWINENLVNSLDEIAPKQRLFSINSFAVPNGSYELFIAVEDQNLIGNAAEITIPVEIGRFDKTFPSVSDLQLASHIQADNSSNPFVKNGYKVVPNPTLLYGIGLPFLYCYAEIYNLVPATSDSGKQYSIEYIITDRDNRQVKRFQLEHMKPGKSAVQVYKINVVTLFSGPYNLIMKVRDLETNQVVSTGNKFYVYREGDFNEKGELVSQQNSEVLSGSPGLDAHRYDVMSEEDVDKEFRIAKYIAKSEEVNTYKDLTLEGKREFIKSFWASRDDTPGTPVNEFKKSYFARVDRADKEFKGSFKEGWKTDQGRVLLMYGNPDEIERSPFGSLSLPFEIWSFHEIEGGVIFVFIDSKGLGEYELIHSTKYGELYNEDWKNYLSPDRDLSSY